MPTMPVNTPDNTNCLREAEAQVDTPNHPSPNVVPMAKPSAMEIKGNTLPHMPSGQFVSALGAMKWRPKSTKAQMLQPMASE